MSRFVLVGGGQVAAVAARTLRRRGYDGEIVVIGEEPHRPYQRPPLSKEYLAAGDESALDLLPEEWTDTQDVEVRVGTRVLKVSAADGAVLLDDGSSLAADAVLLGTGARARRIPGIDGPGVFHLRGREEADALRAALTPGTRVVMVGGGFIGGEVASTAVGRGAEVTVLEAGPVPLAMAIGPRLGAACARLQQAAGVDVRVDTAVTGVRREGERMVVSTTKGDLEADVVVVGVGAVPNVELAVDSGLDVDSGVVVDERCRTSLDRVYAAGDVASHSHPGLGRRVRVEHFDNASRQAAVAARNMLGEEVVYDEPHWFWSDQFGHNLQHVGHAAPTDRMVVRGDLDDDVWTAFFLAGDRVTAAFAVDAGEDIAVARELITSGIAVADEVLADRSADLFEALEELA
ncbi:NAD(P)/FAD-dependent oxidoreductase [Nocardioides halotolerans]|jgi:3-phenylpropionate/trans-cinnamate dioxygenase ferredoxin reductase subunit|uniref:NAD(P)/FAD-dependent oxidoreductase n=1 Tax=Nocardioides halotolerans TaxID=433660 RepID=UPI000405F854|nr:FAD-dependent oxidoreductase [Nocardioides halotolerans]